MFDKIKFANILTEIKKTYSNQEEFAKYSGIGRTYISQYMNCKMDFPPKPELLKKIALSSKGITTYDELMSICGYLIINNKFNRITNSLSNPSNFFTVPIFIVENGKLCMTKEDVVLPNNIDNSKEYFGYRATDESMAPLFGVGDIAIIQKTNEYETGKTFLIELDNSIFLVRKIIKLDDGIELHPLNPYFPISKLTNEELKSRNFKVLGRMIKSENQSAFQ